MQIIKRDGSTVEFNKSKIEEAILKAMKNGSGILKPKVAKQISEDIEIDCLEFTKIPTVYQVEDMVYLKLISYKQKITAKAYEGYRAVQQFKRENDPLIESVLGLINLDNKEVMSENSNKDATLVNTSRDLISGEVSKFVARNYMLPPHLTQAEDLGIIKIHDKDYIMNPEYNCELINLKDMLENGTVINKKRIRKPNSLRTAMTIATQISAQVSSQTYGGQTLSLTHLSPFVRISEDNIRKELMLDFPNLEETKLEEITLKRLKKEIKDSVQLFNYQINTISGSNGQTPFCSLVMYIGEDKEYERETSMLIEEFLNQRIDGMENEFGVKISQTFPKLLYFLDENNTYEGSKYFYLTELSAKSVAKRLSPDFISVKKMKEIYGTAYGCMGCRAFLTPIQKEDGTFDMYGRGNLGVTTLNLPHVALSSKGDVKEFFKILETRLDLCKEVGVFRFEKFRGVKAKVAPILWQHGAISRIGADDYVIDAIKDRNFTVSIGYIGLHETVKYMTGSTLTQEEGIAFGLKVMKYMEDYKNRVKEETGLLFAIYGTPSESTAGVLSEKLREQFGVVEGITDKGYLINSYHIDIKEEVNAFDKLRIEQEFAKHSTGGTITYVEVANMTKNIEAMIQLIQYMYETNIYAEINTKSDMCSTCGFDGEMEIDRSTLKWSCPQCGETAQEKLSVVRRTCGYISDNNWGEARLLDIINRVLHL